MSRKANQGEMVIYQTPDGGIELDVLLEQESIWLNLNQLSALLGRDKSVISRHLRNIFKEEELEHESVVAKNATTASDGKTYQVDYYNLDAIISVGYRVNSKRGTQFRIWATKVLRQHIVQGYTVNQARLGELHQAVKLIADTAERRDLSGDEAKALLAVVGEYSDALGLLDDYDHQRVAKPDTRGKVTYPLEYEEALRIVEQLREQFAESAVFGVEKTRASTRLWAPSCRPLAAKRSTQAWKRRRPICFICWSRTMPSWTATSASPPPSSCGFCPGTEDWGAPPSHKAPWWQ
jgi:hypothetical protein